MTSLFLLVASLTFPSLTAPSCSDAGFASWPLGHVRQIVDADGIDAEQSRRIYGLPRASPDSVVWVNDERVCERASQAYYRHRLGPTPAGGVVVLRVANRYLVYGAERAGEWTIMTIFSLAFEPIANVGM